MATEVKFHTGRTVFTRGVINEVADSADFSKFVIQSMARHCAGDWGDLEKSDKRLNDRAVNVGERILSAYEQKGLPKIWIITEADRSQTTVLFPDEY